MSNIQATDTDRRMVEPVMEVAQTSDLPQWALTMLRGRAALLVAMAREEGRRIERNAWLKALADSFLSEVDCRTVRDLALAPCDNCGGDAATCDCDES